MSTGCSDSRLQVICSSVKSDGRTATTCSAGSVTVGVDPRWQYLQCSLTVLGQGGCMRVFDWPFRSKGKVGFGPPPVIGLAPKRSSGCSLVVIAPRSNAVNAGCSVRLELPLPAMVERQAIDDEAKHAVTHFKRVSRRRHVPDLKRHVQATCPQRAAPAAQMALAHGPQCQPRSQVCSA